MQFGHKNVAGSVILAAGILVGVYSYFERGGAEAADAPAPAATNPANPHASMPGAPADATHRKEGKAGDTPLDPNQKFTHFRVGDKNVKSIYADGSVVWVGTSGGAVRYDTRNDSFKMYTATNGLLSNGVFYVGKIRGKITVGTYGGGMSVFDEASDSWKTYNVPEGLGDAFVYDVVEAKNGDIWIATWSGANRVRGGALDDRSKWDLYTVENTRGGLPNDWVYGLAEGRNGDIWLATEGGMARYAGKKWTNWNHAKGLGADYERVKDAIGYTNDPGRASSHHTQQKKEMGLEDVNVAYNPNYVVSLEFDRKGQVWAGTWGGGLSRFDGKKWTTLTTTDGLPGNHVFMLHEDPMGRLWVGTNNGLAMWQNGKFGKVMKTADGLFADNVFSMDTTAAGDLWVGSYGGVAHIRNVLK
mgnify:CR=1 FL=1